MICFTAVRWRRSRSQERAGALTSSGADGGAREQWRKVDPIYIPNPILNPILNPTLNPILNPISNPTPNSTPISNPIPNSCYFLL